MAYQNERPNVEAPDLTTVLIRALCKLAIKECGIRGISDMCDIKIENKAFCVLTAKITEAAKEVVESGEIEMESEHITSRRIGRLMGTLRFKDTRENGTGKRMWEFTPREAMAWADRYALNIPCDTNIHTPNVNVTNGVNVTDDTAEAPGQNNYDDGLPF